MQDSGRDKRGKTKEESNGDAVEVDLTQDPDDDRGPEILTISDDEDDDDAAANGSVSWIFGQISLFRFLFM